MPAELRSASRNQEPLALGSNDALQTVSSFRFHVASLDRGNLRDGSMESRHHRGAVNLGRLGLHNDRQREGLRRPRQHFGLLGNI